MITMYMSSKDEFQVISDISEIEKKASNTNGSWINMVNPTRSEVNKISELFNIDPDFLNAALDEEERSRIELDDINNHHLILVDTPHVIKDSESRVYETIPIGIIATETNIITICLKPALVLEPFTKNLIKTFHTYKKSRFILQILYKNASIYLYFLKVIDKQSEIIESELEKFMRNKELMHLLTLEKSLVYFSTSLKSNALVLERLSRHDFIKQYDEDLELLEDTIIENKQAIEMAKIYTNILAGTRDAFASIISNNLNIVMKRLTSITIIMALPTIISSFFGMNVVVPLEGVEYAFEFICLISVLICIVISRIMIKKNMF